MLLVVSYAFQSCQSDSTGWWTDNLFVWFSICFCVSNSAVYMTVFFCKALERGVTTLKWRCPRLDSALTTPANRYRALPWTPLRCSLKASLFSCDTVEKHWCIHLILLDVLMNEQILILLLWVNVVKTKYSSFMMTTKLVRILQLT